MLRPVPSLKNMTINQCAPGCRLGWTGEGTVARRSRGKGKSAIFVGGGGGGIAFIFRPGGLNRTIRPVTIAENMRIKRRSTRFGLKRPGDCMAPSFFEGDF